MSLTSPRSTFLFLLVAAFSAAFVSADKKCHSYDKNCDVAVDSGKAIYKLWSKHRNKKEDRIWTFYEKTVPFATSTTTTTSYVNNWDGKGSWTSSDDYLVGWYSTHKIVKKTVGLR